MSPARFARLRLARSGGVGPVGYRKAVAKYGGAEAALAAFGQWARKGQALATEDRVRRELEQLERAGGTLLLWGEDDYPAQLAELPDAPLALSVLGDVRHLHARQVALVGNRNASAAGLTWSRDLATALAGAGVVVTSGLARGIDTAAHEGALRAGGATVAVVAGGVDHIYPPENAKLRAAIIANGAVISEQAWGMAPTAQMFPRRNRIIAGLSVGVAVSEATRHSGSLISAQCALDYGREVWAVPGSPSDPRAGGPNWLLKNGATLVEGVADILAELPTRPAPYVARAVQPALLEERHMLEDEVEIDETAPLPASPRAAVYELLGPTPVEVDTLVRQCGLREHELTTLLVELEMEGHTTREADGRWRRG
ncbi:MAG: DNA-protecting protein DprA [Pseudomonadaceae bacterium]|nr:DNA-protecting protein DprA [Pseudomonadaceae bacterium]